MKRWAYLNGLALVVFGFFVVFLLLQALFGWQSWNDELAQAGRPELGLGSYLASGHFVEATFENWESEFFQMGSYVLLTAFLVQKGSAESKRIEEPPEPGDSLGRITKDSPGPVHRGGWVLRLYENSLALAFFALFLISFLLHLLGGTAAYNAEQSLTGQPAVSVAQFLGTSEFWFQSMQNWQSEFLAVGAIIVLSIFLRQKGSPQSKAVAAPHHLTGD